MTNYQYGYKLMTCLLLVSLFLVAPTQAQSDSMNSAASSEPKNNIMVGVGGMNLLYMVVNRLDNIDASNQNDSFPFSEITTNETSPLLYFKYENKLGRRHTLGVNVASSGFTVGGLIRDSFFFNDLGVQTQLSLKLKYRSNSINFRYNFLFNPDDLMQVYWGLGIGFRSNVVSIQSNNRLFTKQLLIPGLDLLSVPTIGFESTLGFRGSMADHWGWYAEMGMAKSIFQGGISYSF